MWKEVCRERIIYKHPQHVPENWRLELQDENLYVFADFVKPSMTVEEVYMTPEDSTHTQEGKLRESLRCIGNNKLTGEAISFFPMVREEEIIWIGK